MTKRFAAVHNAWTIGGISGPAVALEIENVKVESTTHVEREDKLKWLHV